MDGEFDNTYIIGYVIEGDCEWEPEHGIDIIILNDKVVDFVGPGAFVPITSFGHSLVHGALMGAEENGLIGVFGGMFNLTAAGISSVIFFTFIFSFLFNPRD